MMAIVSARAGREVAGSDGIPGRRVREGRGSAGARPVVAGGCTWAMGISSCLDTKYAVVQRMCCEL